MVVSRYLCIIMPGLKSAGMLQCCSAAAAGGLLGTQMDRLIQHTHSHCTSGELWRMERFWDIIHGRCWWSHSCYVLDLLSSQSLSVYILSFGFHSFLNEVKWSKYWVVCAKRFAIIRMRNSLQFKIFVSHTHISKIFYWTGCIRW